MLSKEEIEKAKEDLIFFNEGDYITMEMDKSADILEEYIKQLEQENKLLKQCLIDNNTKDVNEHLYLGNKNI